MGNGVGNPYRVSFWGAGMISGRNFYGITVFFLVSFVPMVSHASENLVTTHYSSPAIASGTGSFLFVTTKPFGARVYLDGVQIEGRTPLVLKGLSSGERLLSIEMSGFDNLKDNIEIGVDEAVVVDGVLNPAGISLFLRDGILVGADGKNLSPGGYSFGRGSYNLDYAEGSGVLSPVYPNQQWIDALNIAIPIVSVFAGGLVIAEMINPRTESVISPFTIGVLVSDLLMIGTNIGFHVHRSRWRKDWMVDSAAATPLWAEDDYRLAEEALAAGFWEKAQILFDRYTLIYPLDELSPTALYRSARLSFLQGDVSGCIRRIDRMKTNYPVPEYWDRIWRLSAEAAFRNENLDEGLDALDMIIGLDESIDLESVALKRATVLTDEFEGTGDTGLALDAWSELIENWPESDLLEEYQNQRKSVLQAQNE